ncbi:hypothetical protein VCRA2112O187_9950001 [Vibrio crassostreae]|nr:hypothetical protein VCRA2110O113_280002 [Vibrio crassostreae]CAK2264671.1 hypothetical protein VCRA2112O187_9950001 [Vibrio crassostreae]CAK3099965.1 hypothetical protein VCRA2134O405_80003 [Vibrio crassostreae]
MVDPVNIEFKHVIYSNYNSICR